MKGKQEPHKAAFEQAAIGIAISDFEGYLLETNQRCVELLGYSSEELCHLTFLDLTHPDDLERTKSLVDQLLSGEIKEYSLEKKYVRKDGRAVWSHTTVTALRDERGNPYRLVGILEDISERKRAEEALQKSEIFNRAIIESSRDCIKILSLEGALLWISDVGTKSLRISDPNELLGHLWIDLWDEQDREAAHNAIKAARNGATGSFVGSISIKGESIWWDVIVSPILDLNGKPEKLLAVSREITNYVRSKDRLREESHILELLNQTGAAIASKLDLQELVQIVTDAAREISGAQFTVLFYNSMNDKGEEYYRYAFSGTQPQGFESFNSLSATPLFDPTFQNNGIIRVDDILNDSRYREILKDKNPSNRSYPVRSYLSVPVVSRSGEVIGGLLFGHPHIGVFRERTEKLIQGIAAQAAVAIDNARLYEAAQREIADRKASDKILDQTQRELRLHQLRLESIIRYSEDAIITKTLQGIIQSWNPAAERIFGYKEREVLGKPIFIIVPPELRGEEAGILSKISRGERVEHFETERVAKDGRRIFISVTSSPIKDSDGKIIGATKIARDVTERRQHQAAVEQSELRYRALAEERSRLLAREFEARRQVEEANQTKDQFLATLSHELRTPLNAILGWAQLASRNLSDTKRTRESLEIIERNARSQAQIIEDLLDMNRIVSGNLRLETQNIELQRTVDEAIDTITPSAQAKDIQITRLYECDACSIVADPNRIKQIIWNLLTNAVKFTPKGGSIKVAIKRERNRVSLTVADSGEGITPEFLPHIFDRFSQADTSSARRFGGLGLGLSIVRHLVQLHGGVITAQSEGKGKGSTFTVTLPLSAIQAPKADRIERVSLETFKDLYVLVVDDEPDARELLKILLEEHGAKVVSASSSIEALNLCDTERFDLIISDIGMPNEDGYQFIRKVRTIANGRCKMIPAIALTAYARMEDRIQALDSGFQMHVSKPVEPSELIAVVKSTTRVRD